MSIAVLVVTDGRDDYLKRCVGSLTEQISGPVSEWWMFDDTGGDFYRTCLAEQYPTFRHINGGPRQGFGGAIRAAWSHLAEHSAAEYVFHVEQDFEFVRPVNLAEVAAVLADRAHLVQLALRRQPWNDAERAAGGIVEQHPQDYTDCRDDAGREWLEHRRFFTTNPSLYRRSLCSVGWPDIPQSEGHYTHRLLREGVHGVPGEHIRFGFWGARDSGEWVEHIGHERAGTGY